MARHYKIKRYDRIYRRSHKPRISPVKALLILASAGILFFLGWSLYQPVYDLLTGNMEVKSSSSSQPEPSSQDTVSNSSDPSGSQAEQTPEPQGLRAAWLPVETARDPQKLTQFIAQIKASGLNSAVIQVKNRDGEVLYASSNETVLAGKAVVSNPVNLGEIFTTLKENGITPLVQIHAFQDHTATKAMKDAAVRYKPDTNYLWIDNDSSKGGKSWLNPNSQQAQAYILAIQQETISLGAKGVFLDSVQFPEGVGLNFCEYGTMGTKQEVLIQFMEKARQQAGEDVQVFWQQPADANFGGGEIPFGGDAASYGVPSAVDVMPAALLGVKSDEFTVQQPVKNPYEAVKAALGVLRTKAGETSSQLMPILQGYTDATVKASENLTYTTEQVDEQLKALEELGLTSYLLYEPNGDYSGLAQQNETD